MLAILIYGSMIPLSTLNVTSIKKNIWEVYISLIHVYLVYNIFKKSLDTNYKTYYVLAPIFYFFV